MNDNEQSASELWLEVRAPGFRNLPDPNRRTIFDFAFLWSLFEAQIMSNFARADRIRERLDRWAVDGTLETDLYDAELAYFRNRYFSDGALTYLFPYLNLRQSDHPDLVQAVIEGKNSDPRDRMLSPADDRLAAAQQSLPRRKMGLPASRSAREFHPCDQRLDANARTPWPAWLTKTCDASPLTLIHANRAPRL